MSEIYVVWNVKDDSPEGLCYVGSDLADVQRYEQEYGGFGTRFGEDRRVCKLVEVETPPMLGPVEPSGSRISCPSCNFTEYVGPSGQSARFRALAPASQGSIRVSCPQCTTQFTVEVVS